MALDFQSFYRVESMPGVAWYLREYVTTGAVCEGHPDNGLENEYFESGQTFYCDGSCDEDGGIDTSMVVATMVGDDREHTIDVDDLVKIEDDDFCPGCGQTECGHYG